MMDNLSQLVKRLAKWGIIIGVVLLALSAVGGYFLSRTVVPKPKVGVVYYVSNIGGIDVARTRAWFDYVRRHPEIRALVLIINSPGGGAASGEEIYYQVRAMRGEMPVVAVIDQLGASAAYRIALGTNHIYAKPSSLVGSVGTAFQLPSGDTISERAYTTGPHKGTGSSTELYVEKLGLLHEEFVNSVIAERGERLKMDRLPLSTGAVFVGLEALEYGLVDEIGSSNEAIQKAASLAGLRSYEVVDVAEEWQKEVEAEEASLTQANLDVEFGSDAEWPVFYHLYFEME
jgi:protease-4